MKQEDIKDRVERRLVIAGNGYEYSFEQKAWQEWKNTDDDAAGGESKLQKAADIKGGETIRKEMAQDFGLAKVLI